MSTSEVHAAIQALYGQNAERQKAANAFLVQFASTPAAWETALALLGVADPAVQYFGANMLYGKCKSDWGTLPEAHRGAFSEAVGTHLSRLAGAPGSSLAARRLCLVMAAAATRAGPAQATALVDRALALAAGASAGASAGISGVTLALEMQAAIAEETNDAVTVVERQGLVDALVPRLTDVLGTAESVFERCSSVSSAAGTLGGGSLEGSLEGFESLRAAALHAALAWLRLDERGGGGIVLSPGQLASSRGGLLRGALACLGADDAATSDEATEFCVAALAYGAPPSPVPGEDDRAVVGMCQALVASGSAAVGDEAREDLARNTCKVAVAVVERDATLAASASAPEACLALTSLVLSLAETHERSVMEASADYFLMINTVPASARHPALRAPLFQRALAACARHAAFPAGFVSWRETPGEDRDAFHRFREQTLCDVLDNCFGMCGLDEPGGGYLGFVAAQLEGAASWQQAESALFMARAAASAAKRLVVRTRASVARERETPAETRAREGTDAFLRQTLTRIGDARGSNPGPKSAVFASHPLVVAAAARVVGAYAPWLGQAAGRGDPEGVARGCAAYLLAALQAPEAFGHASGAFHALCAQCADAFARRETVHGLLDAAESALPEAPPAFSNGGGDAAGAFGGGGVDGDDDRAGVAEGLARVVAAVADPREAAACAKRLTAPIMARAARHAARAETTGELPSALAAELKLFASAVRFLEFPGFDAAARRVTQKTSGSESSPSELEHPALAALGEAWPTLVAFTAEPWRSVPAVADATSAVFEKALLCAKARGVAVAPRVLEALVNAFAAHHHASCLDALATAAEACFSFNAPDSTHDSGVESALPAGASTRTHENERLCALFCPAFGSCVESAAACLSAHPIADKAEVARALFECAHKMATFAPFVFLNATHGRTQGDQPTLACHTALSVAVAALSTREREATRAATALLSIAAAPGEAAARGETWRAGRARSVDAFFSSASGEACVAACLVAGADHAPRQCLRPLAQVLCALRATYGAAVDVFLTQTLADASFPDAAAPASPGAREAFCALATRSPPLEPRRWAAACVDFFLVCRRELGEDALVAHQM